MWTNDAYFVGFMPSVGGLYYVYGTAGKKPAYHKQKCSETESYTYSRRRVKCNTAETHHRTKKEKKKTLLRYLKKK